MTGHPQGSPEWLAERRTMIGASEAAAALGISPWTSPLELYKRKRGELPEVETTMAMRRGTALEPVILDAYAEKYATPEGDALTCSPPIHRHADHLWMGASFDALRGSPPRVVEAKSVSYFASRSWGEPGTDEVPDYYLVQVMHQLEVALSIWPDAEKTAHLVALVEGEEDIRVYPITYDADLAAAIVAAERDLWERIQAGNPPDPTTGADVSMLFPRSTAEVVIASADVYAAWEELVEVRARLKADEARKKELADLLQVAMLDHDTLADADGRKLVTWKTGKPRRVLDSARMASEHPEIAEGYYIDKPGNRSFLVKEPKK